VPTKCQLQTLVLSSSSALEPLKILGFFIYEGSNPTPSAGKGLHIKAFLARRKSQAAAA
jgi:hypothetical protein